MSKYNANFSHFPLFLLTTYPMSRCWLNMHLSLSGILLLLYLTYQGKIFTEMGFHISNETFFPCRYFVLFLRLIQSFHPLSRNIHEAISHKEFWLILWIHSVALNSRSYSLGVHPSHYVPIMLLLLSFKNKHVLSPWATHNMQLNWIIYFQLVIHVPI